MISDRLVDLLRTVAPGSQDTRSPFMVRYRGKDTFVLANSGDEALAEVVRQAYSFEVGVVPFSAVAAAMHELFAGGAPAAASAPATATVESTKPRGFEIGTDEELNKLTKGELFDLAVHHKIECTTSSKKAELIFALGRKRDAQPAATEGDLPFGDEATAAE